MNGFRTATLHKSWTGQSGGQFRGQTITGGSNKVPRWDVRFDLKVDRNDSRLIATIARAEALASVIRGIPIPPYMREFLDALNIHRAVRGTTGIEGSDLTEEEVSRVLASPPDERVLPKSRQREEQEVLNARDVLEFVAQLLQEDPSRPVTENLISEIHKLTTDGIPYENNVPGEYRSHPVRAGSYSAPPTNKEVRRLMTEFILWLNTPPATKWPQIVRSIAAHFYLISIHPFGDGNGRTARAVESYLLYQAGVNACGFYSLSNFYYRRRQEYEQALDHVRFESNGDLTPFIMFAATGLVEELEVVHAEVLHQVSRIAYRDYARETLMTEGRLGKKAGDRMFHFLLGLASVDSVSLKDMRGGAHELAIHYKGVSPKTLMRDIAFLEKHSIITRHGDEVQANLAIMESYKIGRPSSADIAEST